MLKVILLGLLFSVNAKAHWYALNCSTADQSISYHETKMFTEVTMTKDDGEKIVITTDHSQEHMLTMVKSEQLDLNSIDERECNDGIQTYYIADTFSTKASIQFENNTGIFPSGLNVSEDGKSINAYMICEYTSGGASSCN